MKDGGGGGGGGTDSIVMNADTVAETLTSKAQSPVG